MIIKRNKGGLVFSPPLFIAAHISIRNARYRNFQNTVTLSLKYALLYVKAFNQAEKKTVGAEHIGIFGKPEDAESKVQLKVYITNTPLSKAEQITERGELCILVIYNKLV